MAMIELEKYLVDTQSGSCLAVAEARRCDPKTVTVAAATRTVTVAAAAASKSESGRGVEPSLDNKHESDSDAAVATESHDTAFDTANNPHKLTQGHDIMIDDIVIDGKINSNFSTKLRVDPDSLAIANALRAVHTVPDPGSGLQSLREWQYRPTLYFHGVLEQK
jgi:hypothetical protein